MGASLCSDRIFGVPQGLADPDPFPASLPDPGPAMALSRVAPSRAREITVVEEGLAQKKDGENRPRRPSAAA